MSEEKVIQETKEPATRSSLRQDLHDLGVRSGVTLLVHSSLRSLGWVCGGAQAVVEALIDSVGETGTLVMPTHTSDLSDPVFWVNPPVPTNWWPTIRETMPAFDPLTTPTRSMGRIVECFRTSAGVLRSQHPQSSFAALGPNADRITSGHQFNYSLGDGSPLARIYDLKGNVLLLGVGHDRNTSLHLAEYRAEPRWNKEIENGAPVLRDGRREWTKIKDLELNCDDFDEIGNSFAKKLGANSSLYKVGTVGQGRAVLVDQPALVDFAVRWMGKNR